MVKKNVETPPETVSEKAETNVETLQKQNVETEEDSLSASIINKVFHERMEGLSLREIAEENGLSLSTVQRMLEGIEVEDLQEPSDQEAKSIEASLPTTIQEIEPTQIPDGYALKPSLTPEEYQKFAKMDKPALLSEVVNLKATNSSLQARAILRKGDGESPSQYGSNNYIDALGRLVDKVAMQKQAERIVEKMFPSENNETLDRKFEKLEDKIERLAEKPKTDNLEKAVQVVGDIFEKALGRGKEANPFDYYRLGRAEQEKFAMAGSGKQTNEYDLRNTELKQLHDVEMAKLGWEKEKYVDAKESTKEIIGTVKDVVKVIGEGPIGRAIGSMGEAKANQIMRHGQPPKVISINCPGCGKPFNVVEGSRQVVCPGCNVVLQLNQPSQPPPAEAPTQEALKTETPQETRNETVVTNIEDLNKKPEQKHPDVLENF
jgi:hypothetical protein